MNRLQALAGGVVVVGAWASSSCSPLPFESETIIDTVRILASRASEPRARPGDAVTLEILTYDGRTNPPKAKALKTYWLSVPCVNPAGDAYYACFSQFGAGKGGDAGAPTGPGGDAGPGSPRPGGDLAAVLAPGDKFSFTMPSNIIIPRNGVSPSYGLVIFFNFACGGDHLELLPIDPNNANPQQIPIGCFDSDHDLLGPDDFVFGFTRIYAYDQPTEENPKITAVDMSGMPIGVDGGVATAPFKAPLCTQSTSDTCTQKHPIGPVVPPSIPGGKQVWADFFSTTGKFSSSARLLYGPMVSLNIPGETDNNFLPPSDLSGAPLDNFIWIVVHDDQGGADWVKVPLMIEK
jgi:hypothetical protein